MEGNENTKGAATEEDIEESEDVNDQSNQGDTGSGNNASTNNSGNNSVNGANGGKKARTFTQQQVDRMMTREKRQGANAVYNELGIDPSDTKMVAMVKALIASQKTDEQKATEEQAKVAAKAKEAEERVLKAEVKAEAMVLGIRREFVDDMVALVLAKKEPDEDIKTLIGEYKKKYSTWFEDGAKDDDKDDKDDKKKSTGKKGTGSSIKGDKGGKKGNKDDEGQSMGQRLAARRKATMPKKSFWG